jgi:hypothetical protein
VTGSGAARVPRQSTMPIRVDPARFAHSKRAARIGKVAKKPAA